MANDDGRRAASSSGELLACTHCLLCRAKPKGGICLLYKVSRYCFLALRGSAGEYHQHVVSRVIPAFIKQYIINILAK